MKRSHWYRIVAIASATGFAMATVRFYRAGELVTALIIFTVLFGM